MSRTTKRDGKTKRAEEGSIKIVRQSLILIISHPIPLQCPFVVFISSVHSSPSPFPPPTPLPAQLYDAELKKLGLCDQITLCCMRPCFCPTFDYSRSYLYIRENSLESNMAFKYCCGYCSGGDDCVQVNYFDRAPYESSTCFCMAGICPCYGPTNPKPEVLRLGCVCCCQYIDPCCCGEKVVIIPFDNYCCCFQNRTNCCDNCGNLCGPPSGNPKIFGTFLPQPKDASEFVKIAQQVMFDRGGVVVTSAEEPGGAEMAWKANTAPSVTGNAK